MCVALVGRVIDVASESATVEITGRPRTVSRVLVPDVAVGEWVTVGAGWILERIDSTEAGELLALYQGADAPLEAAVAGANGGTP